MAVDKGPIVGGHVLVLPIEHHASQLALPPGALAELERFLSALRSCFAAQACPRRTPPLLSWGASPICAVLPALLAGQPPPFLRLGALPQSSRRRQLAAWEVAAETCHGWLLTVTSAMACNYPCRPRY